jgi:hypothetical protein
VGPARREEQLEVHPHLARQLRVAAQDLGVDALAPVPAVADHVRAAVRPVAEERRLVLVERVLPWRAGVVGEDLVVRVALVQLVDHPLRERRLAGAVGALDQDQHQ